MAHNRKFRTQDERAFLRSDTLRALWSDTHPEELPLFLDNYGLHHNLQRLSLTNCQRFTEARTATHHPNESAWLASFIAKLMDPIQGTHEIPLHFISRTSEGKSRHIALPHCKSQIRFAFFLHEESDRILQATSRSPLTLRAPCGIGVDRVKLETAVTHRRPKPQLDNSDTKSSLVETSEEMQPRQFFLYRGYRRLYKFFGSKSFLSNEEQYPILASLDVQAAFPSIYTHSIAWAIRGKLHTKENIEPVKGRQHKRSGRVQPFGPYFDYVMQRANWNETHGIIVGPEISRIFAEIIFQQIDLNILSDLDDRSEMSVEPETCPSFLIYRYVDNYYVFCSTDADAKHAISIIEARLSEYNLRLNQHKTNVLSRPFLDLHGVQSQTIGRTIGAAVQALDELIQARCDTAKGTLKGESDTIESTTKELHRWQRKFLQDIRLSCAQSGGLSNAAARVPGVIRMRALRLAEGHPALPASIRRSLIWIYIDIAAYFASIRPTDSTGIALSTAILCWQEILNGEDSDPSILWHHERIFNRVVEVLNSLKPHREFNTDASSDTIGPPDNSTPIIVNLLATLSHFPTPFSLEPDETLSYLGIDPNYFTARDYLNVIGFLFYFNKRNGEIPFGIAICNRAGELLEREGVVNTGVLHLALDIMSCKGIPRTARYLLLERLTNAAEAPKVYIKTNAGKDEICRQFEEHPWFVDWEGRVGLWRRVRRRAVRQIY